MEGVVGHTGGLTNPRPWRGRCRAGYSNTGGPPLPRKRAPLQKKRANNKQSNLSVYPPVILAWFLVAAISYSYALSAFRILHVSRSSNCLLLFIIVIVIMSTAVASLHSALQTFSTHIIFSLSQHSYASIAGN